MTAVPIRYMVISSLFGMKYMVIDTSVEGQGRIVCKSEKMADASMIADALNSLYGHPQGSGMDEHEQLLDYAVLRGGFYS